MITFKQFIQEAIIKKWDHDMIDTETAIEILNKYCKRGLEAIVNGGVIYRGFESENITDFSIIDPSTGERTSKDSNNLYQLMMNASDRLQDFPSRSRSLICSTSFKTAHAFGGSRNTLIVVPFDGTKVAVSSNSDLYGSAIKSKFLESNISAEHLSVKMAMFLNRLGVVPSYIEGSLKFTSVDGINKVLSKKSKEEILDNIKHYFLNSDKLIDLIMQGPDDQRLTTLSSIIFTPKSLGISLEEYGDKLPPDREVWCSGRAILISKRMYQDIVKKLTASGSDAHKQSRVTEKVNGKIFFTDFNKTKTILDNKYTLEAKAGYVGYGSKPGFKSTQFRIVAKTAKGAEVGWVNFEQHDDKLEALDLSVQPAHREKGIATEMYKFARELGNDIAPSRLQTGMGKLFWSKKDHSK